MSYNTKASNLPEGGTVLNAVIRTTSLGIEDHGVLISYIHVDREDGFSQGFGGWVLYNPHSSQGATKGTAGHFITRVLEVCGVTSWDNVKGKAIRIYGNSEKIRAIGHIIKDDWFVPEYDFRD